MHANRFSFQRRGFALLLCLALAIGLIVLPQTALATSIPITMIEPSGIYSIRESATSPGRLDVYLNSISGVVIGYASTDTIRFTGGDGTQIIEIEPSVNNVATTINVELADANINRLSDYRGIGHALNLTLNNATVDASMFMENITTVITTANDNSIGLRMNWNAAALRGGYYRSVPTLTFNGSGTLTVYGVDINANDAIMANNIIVESGTLIVDNDSRTSVDGNCISVFKSYTQNGGTVIVKAGAAERGAGLRSNLAGSHATLNDGSLTITGYNPVIGHGTTFTMNGGTLELTAVSGQPTFANATLAIGGASGITTGFLGTSQSAATPETAADILANYRSTSPVYSYLRLPGIPSITSPTADQTVPVQEGQQATLTVAATSLAPLSYQWMTRANSSGVWSAVAGATSATYQTPAATTADQGRQYRCVVSEAGNPAATATSPIFTLRVSSTPPAPPTAPQTGDGGQPLLWLALCGLCALAGCGALAVAHKKRANRRPSAH